MISKTSLAEVPKPTGYRFTPLHSGTTSRESWEKVLSGTFIAEIPSSVSDRY